MMDAKIARRASAEAKPASPSAGVDAWVQHAARVAAAKKFVEACDDARVPILPVKGLLTSHSFYDDPATRPMNDIDFRVRREDQASIARIIERHGWPMRQTSRVYANQTFVIDGVEVDVESHVGAPHVCRMTVSDLFRHAAPTTVLGFPTLAPNFTDHLVLLVLNVFKDRMTYANAWAVEDLALASTMSEFDGDELAGSLRESGVATIGWIVANELVQRGVTKWSTVRDALERHRRLGLSNVLDTIGVFPDALVTRVIVRGSADHWSSRVRAVAAAAMWELEQRVFSRPW